MIIVNKTDSESDKEVTAFKRWLNQLRKKREKNDEKAKSLQQDEESGSD